MSPTPQATATPQPTSSTFGAAVFLDPDDCINAAAGYRIAYPNDWYSNAEVLNPFDAEQPGIDACQYFAPVDFEVIYGSEPSPSVAISVAVIELPDNASWNYGPFDGYAILSDSAINIAGLPGRVQEVEATAPHYPALAVGERYTEYVVELAQGRFLTARTRSTDNYETAAQVLANMMLTLEFVSP